MTHAAADKPFADWIGKRSESEDVITERMEAGFRAILAPHLGAHAADEAALGIHWCLSPAIAPMAELGPDGHPAKSRDLPPVPQPRRMWAGGQIETFDALYVGDRVRRVSAIADVVCKQGRSGELWFVRVDHEYLSTRGLAIRDRQDIVYREASRPNANEAPPPSVRDEHREQDAWLVETTPTLLFRYSALTFNGHRIHYDFPYATEVEGYAGLVVHGPLQATLLFNLAARMLGKPPKRFVYRGVSPAIAGAPIMACGNVDRGLFWTRSQSGQLHMEASIAEA